MEALKMRNVILVLGMHRSGTSAAAGILVKLGGAQPKTLMPAEGGNERGYFESQALMTFHDELLAHPGPIGDNLIPPGTDRRLPPPFGNAPSNYSKRNSMASLSLSLRIPGSAVSRPSGSRFWPALKLGRVSSFRFVRHSKSPFPCGSGSVSRSP